MDSRSPVRTWLLTSAAAPGPDFWRPVAGATPDMPPPSALQHSRRQQGVHLLIASTNGGSHPGQHHIDDFTCLCICRCDVRTCRQAPGVRCKLAGHEHGVLRPAAGLCYEPTQQLLAPPVQQPRPCQPQHHSAAVSTMARMWCLRPHQQLLTGGSHRRSLRCRTG